MKTLKLMIMILLLACFIPVNSWATLLCNDCPNQGPDWFTVYADPLHSTVKVGDTFTVNLMAYAVGPVDLLGWGLDISYDTNIVSLTGAPTIGPDWNPALTLDGDGLAGMAFPCKTFNGANVLLASLEFQAIGLGVSDMTAGFTPGDLTEGFWLGTPFPECAGPHSLICFEPGSVTATPSLISFEPGSVAPVPEPTSMLLLASGLCGLVGIRKKFRK